MIPQFPHTRTILPSNMSLNLDNSSKRLHPYQRVEVKTETTSTNSLTNLNMINKSMITSIKPNSLTQSTLEYSVKFLLKKILIFF